MLKPIVTIGFIFSFSIAASAQRCFNDGSGQHFWMNPLLVSAFKKPLKPNPLLSEYIKPSRYELMDWPNFPFYAARAEARNREWERKSKSTIGGQIARDIANDIINNQVNSLIYGKKMPVAVAPKF